MTKSIEEQVKARLQKALKSGSGFTFHEEKMILLGVDMCLKHLAESGDGFDPVTLKEAFVSVDPSEIAIEPLYRWGARYQHSKDQLVIQALREEIKRLQLNKSNQGSK